MVRAGKFNETALKSQVKDYLALRGIFNFPIMQGLGSYPGLPDRVLFYRHKVIFIEVKTQYGRQSEYQARFEGQCEINGIDYWVIRSLEELEEKIEAMEG